ncbi:MAG: response regulator [Ignavibacteriae bacterium]|nr:response regulator [Ignavibacteriota bacterium]
MHKIAIIDDDPDIVEANSILLEANGFSVVTAGAVDEAIALVSREHPDLIILDVMMQEPDDGFYLANKFRKMGVDAPIIMLTSVSKAIGFNFGASEMVPIEEFLEKPVPPSTLLDRVKFHLAQAKRSNHASH